MEQIEGLYNDVIALITEVDDDMQPNKKFDMLIIDYVLRCVGAILLMLYF